ncbi:EamA family transporter [Bacteroidota bacterium]
MEWYIYAFGAALFASIAALLNKKVLQHEHALEFTASRNVLILILSLGLVPFVNLVMPWYIYLALLFISILVFSGMLFYMKSIRHGEISTVAPMMNISPLFLLILAFLILKEVPTGKQYFGVFLLIIGAYSLQVGIADKGFIEPIRAFLKTKAIHNMIFAIAIFSLTATLDKLIISKYMDWVTYLFLMILFKTIISVALESYRNGYREIIKDIKQDFKLMSASSISIFTTDILYMLAVSSKTSMISLIIPIKRTATLFTTIFGGTLFHERNLLVKILSCIIMIWGAIFILL